MSNIHLLQVKRIVLFGKKIEDIINEIQSTVQERKEVMADIEIQKMYARDVDISKQFSKQ